MTPLLSYAASSHIATPGLVQGQALLVNDEGRSMLAAALAHILTKDSTPPNSGEGSQSDVSSPGGPVRRERMTAGVLAAVRNLELVVQLLPPASLLTELVRDSHTSGPNPCAALFSMSHAVEDNTLFEKPFGCTNKLHALLYIIAENATDHMTQVPGQALAPCADAITRGLLDSRMNEIVRGAYTCVWARVVLQSCCASADGALQTPARDTERQTPTHEESQTQRQGDTQRHTDTRARAHTQMHARTHARTDARTQS